MTYRKEKKYRLSKADLVKLTNVLRSRGAVTLFSARTVNSLYFDTSSLSMFESSEEGLLPRKKVRFRWYHDHSEIMKEVKITSVEGRYKTSFPVRGLKSYNKLLSINCYDNLYGSIAPSLLVTYVRKYYSLEGLRFTVDRDIRYSNPRSLNSITAHDPECVLEVKASSNTSYDTINTLIGRPDTRFSKYCRGLLQLRRYN